eukprot:3944862-Pyramimonas_sp.AAC.1
MFRGARADPRDLLTHAASAQPQRPARFSYLADASRHPPTTIPARADLRDLLTGKTSAPSARADL